jgi:hypothetical protein
MNDRGCELSTVKKLCVVLGRKGLTLFGIGLIASLVQGIVEYSIAIFFMLFLFTMGFVNPSHLPSWLPLNFLTTSPFTIWGGLFLIVLIKAVSEIITYQSKIVLTELVYARLRMLLGYQILK